MDLSAGDVGFGDALDFEAFFADDSGGRFLGGERAGAAGGSFDVEEADLFAVGREGWGFGDSVEVSQAAGCGLLPG